jgi:uncharacterized protein (DUF486 family)
MTWPLIAPILLLCVSNVFMTFAWYGQLKFPTASLWLVIPASWGIAFFEYCLAVPANRIGHTVYSAPQLKTMQEIITLLVFGVFRCSIWARPSNGTTSPPSPASCSPRSLPSTNGARPSPAAQLTAARFQLSMRA